MLVKTQDSSDKTHIISSELTHYVSAEPYASHCLDSVNPVDILVRFVIDIYKDTLYMRGKLTRKSDCTVCVYVMNSLPLPLTKEV